MLYPVLYPVLAVVLVLPALVLALAWVLVNNMLAEQAAGEGDPGEKRKKISLSQ